MAGSPHVLTGTFAGRYTIERELGSGATATVYLARDTQRGISVAVKLLRPELAQSVGAERFLREIRLNEKLHHPHIVPVLDSGEHDGRLYFVLPHMEDGSLRQMLQREKQLPIETAIAIARTIAQALDYAHQQNLIHRDVKPENILFTSGQACLADFGIARAVERALDESTTDTGMVRGTPAYMSPEQASGSRQYDGRSDQYSLACVLYEMLAGVPAFIGPTPEAVIAQRFQYSPRDLRVYRATVPPPVEAVVMRALSLTPADRFATTAEFSAALVAPASPTPEPRTVRRISGRGMVMMFAGAIASAAIIGTVLARTGLPWGDAMARGDSLQIAVFPVSTASRTVVAGPQELIHAALRRWQPLRVVSLSQTAEALRSRGIEGAPSLSEARRIASRLQAGRFVIAEKRQTPTGPALFADYRDLDGNSLYVAQLDLPKDSTHVRHTYEALVDSLLLGGKSDGVDGSPRASWNLLAMQLFIRALAARDEWDLRSAEALLTAADSIDPSAPRIAFWLAQVRSWRWLPPSQWSAHAERAASAAGRLTPDEQRMAFALSAMGRGDYPDACSRYRDLVRVEPRSFTGWFGLGECNYHDELVVRDSRAPGGWRFRSSYQQGVTSYAKALDLLPATYRGFQAESYNRLRSLLFTSGRQFHQGASLGPAPRRFLAVPTVVADTFAMLPRDRDSVLSGKVRALASPEAISKLRDIFGRISARWAAVFPLSAEAKEALAISLELQGDPASLDTLRAAERLATDSAHKLRLVAARVALQVKFAVPGDAPALMSARSTVDSLLRRRNGSGNDAILAPLAALTGRCSVAADLTRSSLTGPLVQGEISIPVDLLRDSRSAEAFAASGCPVPTSMRRLDELSRRIVLSPSRESSRRLAEYLLLGGLVRSLTPPDTAWSALLADIGGREFRVQRDLQRGDRDSARRLLERMHMNRRAALPGEVTADVVVPEARLWLQLGDTATANASLDALFATLRHSSPFAMGSDVTPTVARWGFLTQALALHAGINAGRDSTTAKRSARAALALWNESDPSLKPALARLQAIAR